MRWLHTWLYRHISWYRYYFKKIRPLSLPGFRGVPAISVFGHLLRSIEEADINMRAAAMSYNIFMALFPAVIFFFTLIAFIPIADLHHSILIRLSEVMPIGVYSAVESTITDILKNQHGGLLSFGFLSALFFSSNAVYNMFSAFNKYDSTQESRSELYRRLLSLILTLLLSVFVIVSVILITFGQNILNLMVEKGYINSGLGVYTLIIVKYITAIFIFYTVISCLYFFGSSLRKKFQFITTGATVATAGSVLSTYGFSLYVNSFNSYNKLYGSIGTLLVILFLIYINSLMILYGYELNAGIEKAGGKMKSDNIIQPEK